MSSRKQVETKTTMDQVSHYTAQFAIANATGTLINSTDMKTTVSGTANGTNSGQFLLTLGSDNCYPQVLHFDASLPGMAAASTGSYRLVPVLASGTAGTLTVQLLQMVSGSNSAIQGWTPCSGQSAAEVAKASLTGSVYAIFRNTQRTV